MNRKGDVFQILIALVILAAVAMAGLLIGIMTNGVNTFWSQHTEIMPANSSAAQANAILSQTGPRTVDYTIFFLFLGMNIGVVISAVRTQFNAILIFLFIFLVFISILAAAGFVNLYQGMAHTDAAAPFASQLNLTNFIFSRYTPLIICCLSALTIIIMYGKQGGDIVT